MSGSVVINLACKEAARVQSFTAHYPAVAKPQQKSTTGTEQLPAKPARVLLVDDQSITQHGLVALSKSCSGFEVVGFAQNGFEAVRLACELQPDVMILDFVQGEKGALQILKEIATLSLKPILFTSSANDKRLLFIEAIRLGCRGVVFKEQPSETVILAITKVTEGLVWLDDQMVMLLVERIASPRDFETGSCRRASGLSARELEIARLVSEGYRNKDMAAKLFISEQTVKNHVHNIFDKLGVKDRLQLALHVVHHSL